MKEEIVTETGYFLMILKITMCHQFITSEAVTVTEDTIRTFAYQKDKFQNTLMTLT